MPARQYAHVRSEVTVHPAERPYPKGHAPEQAVHVAALVVVEKDTPAWQGPHDVLGLDTVHAATRYVPGWHGGQGRHIVTLEVSIEKDPSLYVENPADVPTPSLKAVCPPNTGGVGLPELDSNLRVTLDVSHGGFARV